MFPRSWKVPALLALCACALTAAAAERGFNVRPVTLYIQPGTSTTKMAEIDRGREFVVLPGGAPQGWLHVMPSLSKGREISGWVENKAIVFANTPNGDHILFGEAVTSEAEASRAHGRRGADRDAMRLYYAVYDLLPESQLAAESLYRAADIKWQLDYADVFSRSSAKELSPGLREEIDTQYMKEIMKKFPGTKWADMAAFHLLDNKICGDWQGLAKCPEKESEIYEKYAAEHPQAPDTPKALYNAAWRQAALIEIYRSNNDFGKSAAAKQKALALAQRLASSFPQNDWGARGQLLAFLVGQGVDVYTNSGE